MKKLSESMWGGVMDRSAGRTVRNENSIDNYDISEMYEYIKNTYKTIDDKYRIYFEKDGVMHPVIGMSIFRKNEKIYSLKLISFGISEKIKTMILNSSTSETDGEVLKALLKKFRVDVTLFNQLNITKYDHSVSNKLCIDVIQTIIENAKEPLIKKKDE